MKVSLQEYKVPLGVTTVGLLVAGGLATAPVLMAESDSEILAKKNATDIAALTATIEEQNELLDARFTSQANASAGNSKDLEVQVITLNKAISKLSNTIRNKVTPVETTTELQGSVQFADGRLVNLEKAVTQLHRRQNNLKASVDSSSTQSQNASSLANLESRLLILEKAVTRLHHRQMKAKDDTPVVVSSVTSENKSPGNELAVISAADAASQTVENTPTVENIPKPLEVAAASAQPESIFQTNLEKLEKIVQQMSSLQPTTRSVYQSGTGTTSGDTTRTNSSLQVRHLERTLNQLDLRLDILERREQEQEVVVDQLFEIRDHIDSLLNGIE